MQRIRSGFVDELDASMTTRPADRARQASSLGRRVPGELDRVAMDIDQPRELPLRDRLTRRCVVAYAAVFSVAVDASPPVRLHHDPGALAVGGDEGLDPLVGLDERVVGTRRVRSREETTRHLESRTRGVVARDREPGRAADLGVHAEVQGPADPQDSVGGVTRILDVDARCVTGGARRHRDTHRIARPPPRTPRRDPPARAAGGLGREARPGRRSEPDARRPQRSDPNALCPPRRPPHVPSSESPSTGGRIDSFGAGWSVPQPARDHRSLRVTPEVPARSPLPDRRRASIGLARRRSGGTAFGVSRWTRVHGGSRSAVCAAEMACGGSAAEGGPLGDDEDVRRRPPARSPARAAHRARPRPPRRRCRAKRWRSRCRSRGRWVARCRRRGGGRGAPRDPGS